MRAIRRFLYAALAAGALAGCVTNPSQSAALSIQDKIIAKEREGLDALKTGDQTVFADLTSDRAVFVDAHGPASKAEVLKNTAEFKLLTYQMEDVRFVAISEHSGLIAYKMTESGVSHGHEFTARVYVASIWAEEDGKWMCLFSQETAAK